MSRDCITPRFRKYFDSVVQNYDDSAETMSRVKDLMKKMGSDYDKLTRTGELSDSSFSSKRSYSEPVSDIEIKEFDESNSVSNARLEAIADKLMDIESGRVNTPNLTDYESRVFDAKEKEINNILNSRRKQVSKEHPHIPTNIEVDYGRESSVGVGDGESIKPGVPELFESNPELANTVYSKLLTNSGISAENLLSFLEKENIVEKDCSGGKLKAEEGIRGKFTKGSQWEIVKDLKGYPSHAQGGVDVKIGKNGFSFTRDNGVIEAKYGLVLPKIK